MTIKYFGFQELADAEQILSKFCKEMSKDGKDGKDGKDDISAMASFLD